MINIGMWNELTVLRQKDFGIYLGEKEPERASLWNGRGDTSSVFKETEVLLPAKQVPPQPLQLARRITPSMKSVTTATLAGRKPPGILHALQLRLLPGRTAAASLAS